MIVISMKFLAGRFHATPWERHVNESSLEYPPSSWRLLRALVATFYRTQPEGMTTEQLTRILDALSAPPAFHLPPAAIGHTRHYDVANKGKHFFDTFVSLDPSLSLIWLWREAKLDAPEHHALALLLERLNTFGRAESWCEMKLEENFDAAKINCQPYMNGQSLAGWATTRVLVPQAGTDDILSKLCVEIGEMRDKKHLSPPDGAEWLTYLRPLDVLSEGCPPRMHQGKSVRVNVARYTLDSKVLPQVQDTLPFCEKVRRALFDIRAKIENAAHSETLTGKTLSGVPLKDHNHAYFLATDEDGDGWLDHLTIYARAEFDGADIAAFGRLRKIYRFDATHEVRMVLVGLGSEEMFQGAAPIFTKAKRWRSVTPFVLPRFATRGAGKGARPRDTPVEQLKREARLRQLPEIIEVHSSDVDKDLKGYKVGARLVRWLEFRTRRFNGTTGYGTAGFEIEFAEEVNAPLVLGFGAHFGLGLFEPV